MSSYDLVKASNVWDPMTNLPLIPVHANPFIYCSYVAKLLYEQSDFTQDQSNDFRGNLYNYMSVRETALGYIGEVSHDEVMGAAAIDSVYASAAHSYIFKNFGFYGDKTLNNWDYRFVFLMPFLKAAGGSWVGPLGQVMFCLQVLWEMFCTADGDVNNRLQIWMMRDTMNQFWLCRVMMNWWESHWLARDSGAKSMFTYDYLTECPIMAQLARVDLK